MTYNLGGVYPNPSSPYQFSAAPTGPAYDTALAALGPAAWWKLNEPALSTAAVDSSGNGWTMTANGTVTFGASGPIPGETAITIAGAGFLQANGPLAPFQNHDSTTIAWAYQNNAAEAFAYAFGPDGSAEQINLFWNAGSLAGSIFGGASTNGYSLTGAWAMTAVTYTEATTNINLLVNGAQVGSPQVTSALNVPAASTLRIGALAVGGFDWSGGIAQVAVFNSVLSQPQLAALYAAA